MNSNLTNHQRDQLEALAEEYVERKRGGESVTVADYVENYPQLASDIRELFPVVEMLDRAGDERPPPQRQLTAVEIGPGMRLGEYELICPIGRGGMGVVYRAEHVVLGSAVAIKLLPESLSRSNMRERFQREASAAARMHHPNIVRVFDYGVHGDTLYYVMSLVEGWGLDRLVGASPLSRLAESTPSEGPGSTTGRATAYSTSTNQTSVAKEGASAGSSDLNFSGSASSDTDPLIPDRTRQSSGSGSRGDNLWNWTARIGVQSADALEYAHSMGVVHRDIKPSNLMIDNDNKIYVTDFGLAKVADDRSLTGTGDMLGTLRYMPPEAFAGRADHRSDIYGLGLSLYELLTDTHAFADKERGPLMTAICEGRLESLQKRIPGIPRDLQTIIHKAIDVDPASRYQTAGEFRDDLQHFIRRQPIDARRSTLLYRTNRWIRRNRTIAALMALITISLALGLIVSSIGWSRALDAENKSRMLVKKEKSAREFAQDQSHAKQLALLAKDQALAEKDEALENEKREREFAQAIADFTRNDLLALTTRQGQYRFDELTDFNQRGKIKTLQDLLDRAAKQLESRTDLDPRVKAELSEMIGVSYRIEGRFDKAIPLLKNAVALFADAEDHQKEIWALNSLAVALSADRQKAEAVKSYQLAIDLALQELDDGDPWPIYLKRNYARCLADLEQYDDAIRLAREALAESRVRGAGEPYMVSLSSYLLGDILSISGNHQEALVHLEEALQAQQQALTKQHPYLWDTMAALSLVYDSLGDSEHAIEMANEVVQLKQDSLATGHYSTAISMNDLAIVLRHAGKNEEATQWARKSVQGLSESIRPEHIDSILAINNLGLTLFMSNRIDESIETFERARRLIGNRTENKELAISVRSNLGFTLASAHRFEESIEIYLEARKLANELRGSFHPKTMEITRSLSTVYVDAKQFDEAIELRREIVELNRKNLASDAPELASAIRSLEQTIEWAARQVAKHP